MSNLDLLYYTGVAVALASFFYLVIAGYRFMVGAEQKSAATADARNNPSIAFLRNALLAFAGIIVGSQLLQYHQDQQELSKKDIGKDMAIARAMSSKPAASASSGAVGVAGVKAGLGERPTSRPPRGYFSMAEAEKAGAVSSPGATATVPPK